MQFLYDMLLDVFRYFFGWLGSFINAIYTWLLTTFIIVCLYIVNIIQFCCSYILAGLLYIIDLLLKAFVGMNANLFRNDAFGAFGLVRSVFDSYYTTIVTLAPNVKLVGYVINFEALNSAFQIFCSFLLFWTFYRWFRVWVRG